MEPQLEEYMEIMFNPDCRFDKSVRYEVITPGVFHEFFASIKEAKVWAREKGFKKMKLISHITSKKDKEYIL